jgi:transposase
VSRRATGSSSHDRRRSWGLSWSGSSRSSKKIGLPRKQRHTAKRIWERLREDGFTGGYTVVKDAVRELTQKNQEVFVPLQHRPGEAQVDFGYALVKMNGHLRKVAFFVMALPYSDAFFVMAFERECTETFWEGHVRAFEFFKGVPNRITYDNTKVAVSKIAGQGATVDAWVSPTQESLPVCPSLLPGGAGQ